jgi:hypothetical protein
MARQSTWNCSDVGRERQRYDVAVFPRRASVTLKWIEGGYAEDSIGPPLDVSCKQAPCMFSEISGPVIKIARKMNKARGLPIPFETFIAASLVLGDPA